MDWKNLTKQALALRMIGIGWYIAFCLVGGAAGGYFLDRHLDTLPLFTMVLLTVGLFVAMYGVYRIVRPLMKEEQKKPKGEN